MRTIALLLSACALLAVSTAGAQEHPLKTESGWFDLQNCEFCRNLLADPGLLPHMTWENHRIAQGMIQVFTVEPEYVDAYLAANEAIGKLGTAMMDGTVNPLQVKMCGSCAAFGHLMMAGAKMEQVAGDAADVTLITAADPALVARIHDYCDRNNQEMALMMGGEPSAPGQVHVH